MTLYCDSILTIEEKTEDCYCVKENVFCWTDEMIEGLVEEEMSLDKAGQITDFEYEGLAYTLPKGYIFKDENGNIINATKIVLEKKKKEYPKSYEECCKVMKCDPWFEMNTCYHGNELSHLYRLLICRDAYWKLAGDWKPDYDSGVDKFGIICMDGVVQESNPTTNWERHLNKILDFPTKEMRDAFYENFKELIEQCKELL